MGHVALPQTPTGIRFHVHFLHPTKRLAASYFMKPIPKEFDPVSDTHWATTHHKSRPSLWKSSLIELRKLLNMSGCANNCIVSC